MKYSKPALTFEQQADQLMERGMIGDRALLIDRLKSVNYHRLSAYWFPFRSGGSDERFLPNTRLEVVWDRYVFDRHLRLLVMDAIERIEIAIRTNLSYYHSHQFGPFGYAENPALLPDLKPEERNEFYEHCAEEFRKSTEGFCEHFRTKYGSHHVCLPVWIVTELMTFGGILTFFRGSPIDIQEEVASVFGTARRVFKSWLFTLNTVRNICAHHSRLWNRELGMKPMIPRLPDWQAPFLIPNNRAFTILTICRFCLKKVAPQTQWCHRVQLLLDRFPEIPRAEMGFPENWQDSPIWKEAQY